MDRWRDRVAVVTGASEGIGEAIVRKLAANGMKVVALARRQQLLEAMENELREAGAEVTGMTCDVTNRQQVVEVFARIEEEIGPVSVLVNNAGLLLTTVLNSDLDLDNAQRMLDCNIMGVLNCTKAALEVMKRNNIDDGHIVNISSMMTHIDTIEYPELAVYAATKKALNTITKTLKYQAKMENSKMRASIVSPGIVDTELVRDYLTGEGSRPATLSPVDVASAVQFVLAAPQHVNVREVAVSPS